MKYLDRSSQSDCAHNICGNIIISFLKPLGNEQNCDVPHPALKSEVFSVVKKIGLKGLT